EPLTKMRMGPIDQKTLEKALMRIQSFRKQLNNSLADKMLDGTLYELGVHFLQRAMPFSYCFDLDFIVIGFENHEPVIRAVVEIKKEKRNLSNNQKTVYLQIAKTLALLRVSFFPLLSPFSLLC
ncbi:unnamed protein product, partial [marine sediment metagenome]